MRIKHNVRMAAFFIIASVLCTTFNARKASALDLYNDDVLLTKLKKNQVLSEKDIVEVKSGYPKLELTGSLQLQYLNDGLESSGSDRKSDLFLKRLNLRVAAHLTEKTSFVIEPEYGRDQAVVRDAYLMYKPSGFEIFAGNHRVPFGAEALKNDINLPFAERSLASGISPDYLPGASIVKTFLGSRLIAQAGIWNGNISSKAESNLINNSSADNQIFTSKTGTGGSNILIQAVRVAYSSKERSDFYSGGRSFDDDENFGREMSYGLGLSYFNSSAVHDKAPANGLTGLNGASAFGADLYFRIWRLSTEFEYARRSLDWWQYDFAKTSNESVSSTQKSLAAQASVLLLNNLSFNLRYETFVFDDKGTVLKGAFGQNKDKWLTAGFNYYFKEQHTKIQADYVWKSEEMPAGVTAPENNTLYLQATMYF